MKLLTTNKLFRVQNFSMLFRAAVAAAAVQSVNQRSVQPHGQSRNHLLAGVVVLSRRSVTNPCVRSFSPARADWHQVWIILRRGRVHWNTCLVELPDDIVQIALLTTLAS